MSDVSFNYKKINRNNEGIFYTAFFLCDDKGIESKFVELQQREISNHISL